MVAELTAWQLADIFKRQLVQREAQMTNRLVAAYSRIQAGLKDKIDLLEADAARAADKIWKVQQLERWRTTKAVIEQQMAIYGGIAQNEMQADLAQSVKLGLIEAQQLTLGAVPAELRPYIQNAWNLMDPAAVENALGYFTPGSPLVQRINSYAPGVAQVYEEQLTNALVMGYNPRKWAKAIESATGQPLAWAVNTARTTQLNAYRQSAMAS